MDKDSYIQPHCENHDDKSPQVHSFPTKLSELETDVQTVHMPDNL